MLTRTQEVNRTDSINQNVLIQIAGRNIKTHNEICWDHSEPGGICELRPWPGRSMQSNLNVVIGVFKSKSGNDTEWCLGHSWFLSYCRARTCGLLGSGAPGAQRFQHCPTNRVKLGRHSVWFSTTMWPTKQYPWKSSILGTQSSNP